MKETKDLIFSSMREASEYFGFPYNGKMNERNDKYLSCYCEWERISRNKIRINKIYDAPKKFEIISHKEYKYKVGDVISSTNSSFEVLNQIRISREKMCKGKKEVINEKGYLVKCIKDGYEFEILEQCISINWGCPVCSNKRVVKGINDVATTHPDIAKLFENIEDAYTTTYSTAKRFKFKCPRCGGIKIDCTNNISTNGFSCPYCSDGVSYPNKFMAKLLSELEIEFDREIKFDWCKYPCFVDKNKLDYGRYDFVIPEMKILIELDGGLGHGRNTMNTIRHNRRIITVEESLYRDKMKDKLAIENGYKIIRIDCIYRDISDRFKNVSKNIIESGLSKIFDFSNVNFDEIDKYYLKNSYVSDVAKLWNEGLATKQIVKEMKLSSPTVSRYLEMCSKLNLCNYNKEESKNRSFKISKRNSPHLVKYGDRKEVFNSFAAMKRYYADVYKINISHSSVDRSIQNKTDYLKRTFIKISQEEFNNYYNNKSLADLVVGEAF